MAVILGTADLSAATNTTLWENTTTDDYVVNIYIANRDVNASPAIRIAIASTATPALSEWHVYDIQNITSFTGVPVGSGEFIVVYSDTANVSVNARGAIV